MLAHPDRQFRDALARHAEALATPTTRPRREGRRASRRARALAFWLPTPALLRR